MIIIFLQDKSADIFAQKIGEAIFAIMAFVLLIAGIIWLVKKAKQK
jgi:heme/copper-type cytochrome/quinol oxidase subunit 4